MAKVEIEYSAAAGLPGLGGTGGGSAESFGGAPGELSRGGSRGSCRGSRPGSFPCVSRGHGACAGGAPGVQRRLSPAAALYSISTFVMKHAAPL